MTKPVEATPQIVSDNFHQLTAQADTLLSDLCDQLQTAIVVAQTNGVAGVKSQRAIAHLTATISAASEARGKLTLAHAAAEKIGETADLPWDCPPDAKDETTPILQVVA